MTASLRSVGAITLFVDDVERSKSWYENVFDLSPVFEDQDSAAFEFDNMIINLLTSSAAPALVAPAEVDDRRTGARFQLTIWVDDADGTCSDLHRRGIVLVNGPTDREWGQRTACFADPDGHIWEIAQSLS
ncbi:MAG TPA: VOC family protein [Ilumatobacteraceae bacterium]|nr:VOC family protein [Ilumatobacteraceae bacterium]